MSWEQPSDERYYRRMIDRGYVPYSEERRQRRMRTVLVVLLLVIACLVVAVMGGRL